jgi:hypothetical protein
LDIRHQTQLSLADVARRINPLLLAGISREPNVMVAHPSVPARTVAEFISSAGMSPSISARCRWRSGW